MTTNFTGGVSIDGVPVTPGVLTTGMIFYVDDSSPNDANDTEHGSAGMPFRTIAYAASMCVNFRGDVIIVGANHSESQATIMAATNPKLVVTVVQLLHGISWTTGFVSGNTRGDAVPRTAMRVTGNLAQTGVLNMFSIGFGAVRIREIYGVVTTAIAAGTSNLKLTAVPSGLAATDLCAAANVGGLTVGQVVSITGTLATALQITAAQTRVAQATPVVCHPGVIRMDATGSLAGQIQWFMNYEMLSPGATVQPF